MRIAIVDDSMQDRETIRADISRWAAEQDVSLEPIHLYSSGEDFLEHFADDTYDIIFLDIYMKQLTGMEAARRIRALDAGCRLIFITITESFAVESYDVASSYYLVKPYPYQKLALAMERCSACMLEQGRHIFVPGTDGDLPLYLHKIAYTEYFSRRIQVHFKDGQELPVLMSQKDFSALLLQYPYFCDCMRGILINLEAVSKLTEDSFLLATGDCIPISRLKYREVREKFINFSYQQLRKGVSYGTDLL